MHVIIMLQSLAVGIPQYIWVAIAVWGIYQQGRAISRSNYLVAKAEALCRAGILEENGPLMARLRNDLLLYQVRFAMVFNNAVVGTLALLQIFHIAHWVPVIGNLTVFGLYAVASIILNELSLNILTWRDGQIYDKIIKSQVAAQLLLSKEK